MSHSKNITISARLTQPHWLGIMAAVGLLLLSVFGLFFVQKPLQETQEVRPEASVGNGNVVVAAQPTAITVNQAASIRLAIDTKSIPTTGVQLVFNIHSTAGFRDMTAQILNNSGLQSAYLEMEQTADGALVAVIALPASGQQFITSTSTPFLELNFTPTSAGTIKLNFDTERSIVTRHGSNPPEDVLAHVVEATYTVTGPSPSPTASPRVSPTPSPTASPNISCNKACSSNDNCPVNYRCYSIGSEKRCRLVTNPTSTTCQNAPDGGLNRRCNEYCADSRECAAGFSCWQNRCRNPQNVNSTSCAALTTTQVKQSAASCNQSCSDNGDCAANLRCHSGRCRLASNPSSQSCSAASAPTISKTYTNPSKGAADGTATQSGALKPSPASTPLVVLPNTPTDVTPAPEAAEQTAQETLLSMILNAEYSLALKVLIAGFILLIVGLIVGGFLSRRRRRFAEQLAQPNKPTSPQDTPPTTQKTPPPLPPRPMPPAQQERMALQSAFVGNQVITKTPPPAAPSTLPTPLPLTPPPHRGAQTPGSMVERLKEKGVTAPHADTKPN